MTSHVHGARVLLERGLQRELCVSTHRLELLAQATCLFCGTLLTEAPFPGREAPGIRPDELSEDEVHVEVVVRPVRRLQVRHLQRGLRLMREDGRARR